MTRVWKIWRMPLLLALLSLIGLIAALVADGAGDVLSWLTLGFIVAICANYGLRRGRYPPN